MIITRHSFIWQKDPKFFIREKYKRIKIYNPESLLEDKMKEYKEYQEHKKQPDKNSSPVKG